MLGFDASLVALVIGGALGASCRAIFTKGYAWRSRFTLGDIVLGALFGGLVSVFPVEKLLGLLGIRIDFQLPTAAAALSPAQKGLVMAFMSWALVDALRDRLLNRWQPRDRRAEDPKP